MAEQQEGRWVTLDNGTHLFIKKGQTLDDAIATLGKEQPTHSGSGGKDFEHKKELTTTVNTLLKEGKNKDQIKNYLKGFNTVTYTEEMDKYVDSLIDFDNDYESDLEEEDPKEDKNNTPDELNRIFNNLTKKYNISEDDYWKLVRTIEKMNKSFS